MNRSHTELSGWGRYNPIKSTSVCPASQQSLQALITDSDETLTLRGQGRSYGDCAVNDQGLVMLQEELNRMLEFDEKSGLLTCEGGVTLQEIIAVALPRGWFLPTTPGTKYVTTGGAIAADVHGKNHHKDGSFGDWVRKMDLVLADGSHREISPDNSADLFWATVGGMGLTGYIRSATIQLLPVETAYYQVDYRKTRNLWETMDLLESTGDQYRYSVGWIDCLARGESLGRSVLMLGNSARSADLPPEKLAQPLALASAGQKPVPLDFPDLALNRFTVKLFNEIYYRKFSDTRSLAHYDSYFYPLDSLDNWNRIYGKRGFIQYQALFPLEHAEEGLAAMLELLAGEGMASFLAVIKRSGKSNPGPLSFLFEGYTLALDIPNNGEHTLRVVKQLDKILLEKQGRLYLAKDSLMSPELFEKIYPRKNEFLEVKKRIDPHNRFSSHQARRVGLVV